jgi:hypothetical protein
MWMFTKPLSQQTRVDLSFVNAVADFTSMSVIHTNFTSIP